MKCPNCSSTLLELRDRSKWCPTCEFRTLEVPNSGVMDLARDSEFARFLAACSPQSHLRPFRKWKPRLWRGASGFKVTSLNRRAAPDVHMLAAVLARANMAPPSVPWCKEAFYEIKDLILKRWGQKTRRVVQHIEDSCWGYSSIGCDGILCDKCDGTGVFRDRWFLLQEWDLKGRLFHNPITRLQQYKGPIAVEGKKQARLLPGSNECLNALFLMFRPDCVIATVARGTINSGDRVAAMARAIRIANSIGPIPSDLATELYSAAHSEPPF